MKMGFKGNIYHQGVATKAWKKKNRGGAAGRRGKKK